MMEGVLSFVNGKTTVFVIEFAHYVGHVLGDDAYTGHFLVEMLVLLLRGNIVSEALSRITLIFNHLSSYPHQVKYHMQLIQ